MIILREYGKFSVQKGQVQKSVLDIHHPETLGAWFCHGNHCSGSETLSEVIIYLTFIYTGSLIETLCLI